MTETIPPIQEGPLKVVIVDITEHRRQIARDAADARLNSETAANYQRRRDAFKDWRGFVRRIWKGNVFREFYQQKYFREEIDRLEESDNLYGHEGQDDKEALATVVDRFASEYDEAIHTEAGESRQQYKEYEATPNQLRQEIRGLIREYATGALDDASFEEAKNRLIAESVNGDQSRAAESLLYADNLLEIAQNVKAAAGHGRAVDELLARIEITTGEARMGARTEARFNRVDKVVDKLSRSKLGSLLPESLIASSVAIAVGFTKWGSQRALSTALSISGVLGLSGGVLGALRESKRIKEDRALHMRERATGKTINTGAKRRTALEKTRYESLGADQLISQLGLLYDGDAIRQMTPDEYVRATSMIAEIAARISMSDSQKIDLIHFSSIEAVEKERFELDLALAKAKVHMQRYLQGQPDDFLPADIRTRDFNSLLSNIRVSAEASLEESNDEKDRAFRVLKRGEVLRVASKAFGWGMIFGATFQEAVAHLPGNDSFVGLGEGSGGSTQRTTMLSALLEGREKIVDPNSQLINLGGHSNMSLPPGYTFNRSGSSIAIFDDTGKQVNVLEVGANGRLTPESLTQLKSGGNAELTTIETGRGVGLSGVYEEVPIENSIHHFRIPKEYSAQYEKLQDGSLKVSLSDQNNQPLTEFVINSDGSVSPQAIQEIQRAGLNVTDKVTQIGTKTTITDASPEEVLWTTSNQATQVRRTLWYGNDTPGVYDQNELRAHAGGVGGDWFDSQGNVVIDVTPMQADGSYWHGQSANPWELANNGQLKASISLSKGTQEFVYAFDFQKTPEGRLIAIIPESSPAHQLFEAGNQYNGHGAFNGRYVEIMEFTGEYDPKGAHEVHMLATYKGQNDATNLTTVIDTTQDVHTVKIDAPKFLDDNVVFTRTPDVTPVIPIPIYGRKGLEDLKPSGPRPKSPDIEGMYYGGTNLEALRNWLTRNPEAHIPRRKITLEDGTVKWVEADGTEVKRDVTRERNLLTRYLDSKKASDPAYYDRLEVLANQTSTMKPMKKNCRVSVNIPAWMEGGTIYELLEKYYQQVDKDGNPLSPELFEINIIVNRKTGSPPDNTVAELERFISDYRARTGQEPVINYVDVEFDPPNNHVGNARKVITDLTLMRSLARTDQSEALYIESEDADLMNVDPRTIANIIEKMDSEPHLDVVRGIQDRNPEIMKENDFLFLWRRMWDFTELFARSRNYTNPRNPNWNFTWNRTISGGWNTAYSAEAYAMIGGYDMVTKGEDMLIGEKITMSRGDGSLPELDTVGRVWTRTDSSPRRFVSELITGRGAYTEAFEDEELNKFIRTASLPEMLDKISGLSRINAQNSGEFAGLINGHYQAVKVMTPSAEEAEKMMKRIMLFLGFKPADYRFNSDGSISILSLDNVAQKLEEYRLRKEG